MALSSNLADPENCTILLLAKPSLLKIVGWVWEPENSVLPLTLNAAVRGLESKLPRFIPTFSFPSINIPILLWVDDWPNPTESSAPKYDNLAPLLPLSTNTIFDVPVAVANLATTLFVFVPCISNDPVTLNLEVVAASGADTPNCRPSWPFNVLSPANVGT